MIALHFTGVEMIRPSLALGVVLSLVGMSLAQAEPASAVPVKVDPRVELLSIVFRLAGNPEYNMPNAKSRYAEEVDTHFGGFRDHATVQLARELRQKRGISYDAVMSLAVHLDDKMPPGERTPLEPRPALLEKRWNAGDAKRFIESLGQFVRDTNAKQFFDDHADFYAKSAESLSAVVNKRPIVPFFDGYFGKRQTASYTVIAGLLNGGQNYGVSMRHADGKEEITPVIGIYKWDADGLPANGEESIGTIIHEFCHAYTNAIVDKHWDALSQSSDVFFKRNETAMRRIAYGNAKTVAYESFVRACVVRAVVSLFNENVGQQFALREACGGFPWTIEFAELLKQYESDRKTYASFDDFVPIIAKRLDAVAADYEGLLKTFPSLVSMSPKNGEKGVDAKTTTLQIVFDRPMKDASWSVVTLDPAQMPKLGKPSYDAARTTLTIPITFEAGKTYRFGLNGPNFLGFLSADGKPLLPIEVTFQTRG